MWLQDKARWPGVPREHSVAQPHIQGLEMLQKDLCLSADNQGWGGGGWTPLPAWPTTGLNHQALWLRASELLFFVGTQRGRKVWMECGPAPTASRTFY